MANIKFSDFTTEANSANVDFLVGYQGTTMKKIAPSNLSAYPFLIDSQSLYSGFVPTGLTSGVQGNTFLGINAGSGGSNMTNCTYIGNYAGTGSTICTENTFVGKNAGYFNSNKNFNTYIGFDAGYLRGNRNVAVGHSAFDAFTATVDDSVAIGYQAGQAVTNAAGSVVFIGTEAGKTTQSVGHVAIGYRAGYSNTTGERNTNIGFQAGYSLTTNSNTTMIGYEAGEFNTGGNNTFIGYHAGTGVSGSSTADRSTIIGSQAGEALTTGLINVLVGYRAGKSLTVGAQNVAIGTQALETEDSRSFSVAVGTSALNAQNASANAYNTGLGHNAGNTITTGIQNTCVGGKAGADNSLITGSNNIVIGYNASPSADNVNNEITIGDSNITALRIPGLQSGASDGDVLTFSSGTGLITLQAGGGGGATDINGLSDCTVTLNSSGDNYFIGTSPGTTGTATYGVTAIGDEAGNAINLSNSLNSINSTFVGSRAGKAVTSPYQGGITAIGALAGSSSTVGSSWTCVGSGAGQVQQHNGTTIIGFQAGWGGTSTEGVIIGKYAQQSGVGSRSISIGRYANRTSSATGTISIGWDAGFSNTTGTGNTNIGYQAGYGVTTAVQNTIIGYEAGMDSSLVAGGVVAIGYQAGKEFEIGDGAVLVGRHAGAGNGSAKQETVFIGDGAGRYISSAFNTAVGAGALRGGTTSGSSAANNVAVGRLALYQITTGDHNVAVGYNAGTAVTTSREVTAIGSGAGSASVLPPGRNTTMLGFGANVSASGAADEITLGNSSIATLRCQVTSITSLSDKRDKTNIEDSSYGLELVDKLKPVTFDWNTRDGAKVGVKDIGFIAQDLQEVDDDYLKLVYESNPEKLEASYGRLVPVLVKAIQDLSAKVTALENA